jgi:hypothetical protein
MFMLGFIANFVMKELLEANPLGTIRRRSFNGPMLSDRQPFFTKAKINYKYFGVNNLH